MPNEIHELKIAIGYAEEQQFKEAIQLCVNILRENPSNDGALGLLILCAIRGGIQVQVYPIIQHLFDELHIDNTIAERCGAHFAENGEALFVLARCAERIAEDTFDLRAYSECIGAFHGKEQEAELVRALAHIISQTIASEGQCDLRQYLDDITPTIEASPQKLDEVCFVAGIMSARVLKIAYGLRANGIKVKLLKPARIKISDEQKEYFDEILEFASPFELVGVFKGEKPMAYHVFVGADGGYLEALVTLILQPKNFVIDMYDLADPAMSPLSRLSLENLQWQRAFNHSIIFRFLMNHTPAICCRALYSKLHRSHLQGAKATQKRIYFPEVAWGNVDTKPKLSEMDGELHVVHGGTVLVENAYKSNWDFILWIAEKANELKFHFHLYAMAWGEGTFLNYEELASRSDFFHLHEALPYEQWLIELCKYDVGLYFAHARDIADEGNTPRNIDPSGSWANKFGDYLDAELYALPAPTAKVLCFATKRYDIGEGIDLDEIFEKPFWDRIKNKVLGEGIDFSLAKKELAMPKQCERLIRFYRSF